MKSDEGKGLETSIISRFCPPKIWWRKSTSNIDYIEVLPSSKSEEEKYLKHQLYRGFASPKSDEGKVLEISIILRFCLSKKNLMREKYLKQVSSPQRKSDEGKLLETSIKLKFCLPIIWRWKVLETSVISRFCLPKIWWGKSTWNINGIEVLYSQIKSDKGKLLEISITLRFCLPK